jgi:hypothetical protein
VEREVYQLATSNIHIPLLMFECNCAWRVAVLKNTVATRKYRGTK